MRASMTVAVGLIASATAHAGFITLADFQNFSTSTLSSQGWTGMSTGRSVVVDPADPANAALRINYPSASWTALEERVDFTGESIGTLFVRFNYSGLGDMQFGLSGRISDKASLGDFEVLFRSAALSSGDDDDDDKSDDDVGGSVRADKFALKVGSARVATLQSNQWYELWAVVDDATDTFNVSIRGAGFEAQTQLADEKSPSKLGFKFKNSSSTKAGLGTFLVRGGDFMIDDVAFDPTGANLTAVPTPGAAVLAAVGLTATFRRRR